MGWEKALLLFIFVFIFYLLLRALIALIRSPADTTRMARALTGRMLFSVLAFVLLIAGFYGGIFVPGPGLT